MIVSLDLYHINYMHGNSNHHMRVRTAGVQFMINNPERFIESNTENSWLRYLNNMSIQGTGADALIIQTVVDALKVACSAGVFLKFAIVNSPPYWNSPSY